MTLTHTQAYLQGVATEETLFKSYADAMITDAQQRGCSNVVPILKAAATTTYAPRRFVLLVIMCPCIDLNASSDPSATAVRTPGNPAPGNTKKRLGLTWQ